MQFKLLLLTVLSVAVLNAAGDYLKERPNFVTPCLLKDPNFQSCYISNFQVLFKEWVHGVPGLKQLGSLDPLEVKSIKLAHEGGNLINLNAIMTNVVVKGLSNAVVKDARIDPNHNFDVDIKLFAPKQFFNFDFKSKGSILSLPINGEGKGKIGTENVLMSVHVTSKIRSEGEHVFMDLQSIKLHIDEIANFRIQIQNLFGDQKELEDSANALFNENWRDIFEVMRPAVEQIIEAILTDRFKKIFAYVPSSYFVADLPHD